MATSTIMNTAILLLGLLATAAHARPLPTENSANKFKVIITDDNIWISVSAETMEMPGFDDCDHESSIKGKVAPSPPSPKSSPPTQQVTTKSSPSPNPETPISSSFVEGSSWNSLISMVTNFGKTPKSPPSPKPAPSKHQGTSEQPVQQRQAHMFPFNSMVTNFGKTPKSPPSPKPAPSKHHGTIEQPADQRIAPVFQFESMVTNFGKTQRSPPSPKPAPSKHQGTIEQPIQIRSGSPDFQFKFMAANFEKTPKSPPSPNPAPSKHQGIIKQPIQQTSAQDFQVALF